MKRHAALTAAAGAAGFFLAVCVLLFEDTAPGAWVKDNIILVITVLTVGLAIIFRISGARKGEYEE